MRKKSIINLFLSTFLVFTILLASGINGKKLITNIVNDDNFIQKDFEKVCFSNYDWFEEAKLIASDGFDGDFFGQSVSIYENFAVVGAPNSDENGEMSGTAYIFNRDGNNWVEQAKLTASDGAEGDSFGCSVSIDGKYSLIGSPFNEENGRLSGSAYIFNRSNNIWTEQAKLLPTDSEEYDEFGQSVSINMDNALIGVYLDDDNGFASGSAYIFTRLGTNWIENTKFLPSDGMDGDWFGLSVSIYNNTAVIGTPGNDYNGNDSGSAYVFKKSPSSDLDCFGDLDWSNIEPGATVFGTINVENIGDPGFLLDWEIQSYPNWGSWSFNPESGIDLPAGDSVTIDVEVVAPNEEETTFTGEIVLVNSEDPSDTCTIDVSLATPLSQVRSYQQILIKFFETHPYLFLMMHRLL